MSISYILILFDHEAAITGENLVVDVATDVGKQTSLNILRQALTTLEQEDDGGEAE